MAVKCNLSTLMGKNRYSIKDVASKTGLAYSTVANFYHDKPTRVDYDTINKLCALFDCKLEDLFEYTTE